MKARHMGDRKNAGELCGSRLPLGLRIESWIPLGDRKKAEELVEIALRI
jgi:hypothetical protein